MQVEHPISEMVSGLDFVKLQLDIANGETLPFKQSDLKMNGYAIECRINAEDTFLDFAPSTGPVPYVTIPSGPNVRCDTYLYPGCTVSPFYDSLMAKLCTWGPTFDESRVKMLNALNDFDIQGVETSIPLYKTILNSEEYKNGQLSTDFLKRYDMIEKLEKDLIQDRKEKQIPAIASAIMHSEFYKSKAMGSTLSKKLLISNSTFATFFFPVILTLKENNSIELEFEDTYEELLEKEIELLK